MSFRSPRHDRGGLAPRRLHASAGVLQTRQEPIFALHATGESTLSPTGTHKRMRVPGLVGLGCLGFDPLEHAFELRKRCGALCEQAELDRGSPCDDIGTEGDARDLVNATK